MIPHSSTWTAERLMRLAAQGDAFILGFEAGAERPMCFAFASRAHDFNSFMFPGPCVILRRLWVLPDQRGRGLGSFLLSSVIAEADVPVMWQTAIDNDGAVSWFRSKGHQLAGIIRNAEREDAIFQAREGKQAL